MTVDQVDTQEILGIMSDEDSSEILYMLFIDGWLVAVIA